MTSKYRIIINPFAELDLKASIEFFEFQKPGLEYEFIKAVDEVIKRIELNPLLFPKVRKGARRAVLTRFPFGIYFVVKDEGFAMLSSVLNSEQAVTVNIRQMIEKKSEPMEPVGFKIPLRNRWRAKRARSSGVVMRFLYGIA